MDMETLTEEQRLREAEGLNINAMPWTGQQAPSWGRTNSGSSLPQGAPSSWQPGQSQGYGGYNGYRESPHSPTDEGHASFGGASSSRDNRPMCKYFAMGGCTRSDCPFSHDLTVEATSTHEAANGFVLSGNVANIRNARTSTMQQRDAALMQRQLSREEDFQQWGSGSVGSPYGDDGRHPVGFMGVNTGNDSQMMSMLLGTAPQAGGGVSNFDLAGHQRPMEFTPYPAPSSHNHYPQGSMGRHGGFHPDDYLPPSELASRFASNNNNSVAALFGSPPTSGGSPMVNGSSGTSPSLGSAVPSFTSYPSRGKDSSEEGHAMISSSIGRGGYDPLQSPSLLPALPSAGVTAPVTASAVEKTHSSAASAGSSDRLTPGSAAANITPSADLFPPLPSTPGQKNSEVSAPAAPPTVVPAPTYAMKAMTGRSATPPSEPPMNDAQRVPKMPVSIDDEMSAFQSMALRQPPEQAKDEVTGSSPAHGRGEAQERHHQGGDRRGGNQSHGKGQHEGGRHHQRAGKNGARRSADSHAPANAPVPL